MPLRIHLEPVYQPIETINDPDSTLNLPSLNESLPKKMKAPIVPAWVLASWKVNEDSPSTADEPILLPK
jgi:hypothetical protein